ncbi:hypothetical protein AMTRI_Chr08g204770 [Amborella trichopoda]
MWTYEMDNCLMNQVLKQVHLGRRVQHGFRCENGFRREAYTEICDEFEKVTGIVLTLESIKNRMKTWERQYDQVIVMVCESGFGWDDKLQKVTTLEEQWSEYLKMYRTNLIHFFSSLPIVLGDNTANGRYGMVGTDLEGNGPPVDDIGCDNERSNDYDFRKSTVSMHGDENKPETKRSCVGEAIAASIFEIVVAFGNAIKQMINKRQRVVNSQELMAELKRVEGLTIHDYFRAIEYLVEHLDIVAMFIDMELELCRDWLLFLLDASD